MAKFIIETTAGTGSALGRFNCPSATASSADTYGYYRVSNGVNSIPITVKQWGEPKVYMTAGDNPIPYSGGQQTWHLTSTHYPFKFENRPSWLTITDNNGRTLSSGNWYYATDIYLTADPSTTDLDRNTYIGANPFRILMGTNAYSTEVIPLIRQNGLPDEPVLIVTPSALYWDWDDTNTKAFLVSHTSDEWRYDADETDWSFFKGGSYLYLTPWAENTTSSNLRDDIEIDADGFDIIAVSATHYLKPTMTVNGSTTIDSTGGSRTVTITCANDWRLTGLPSYVEVRKNNTLVDLSQRQTGSPVGQTYTFSWADNTVPATRTATISLHYYSADNDTDRIADYSQLTFLQGASGARFSVSPSAITVDSGIFDDEFSVSSNVNWTALNPYSWIDIRPTTGSAGVTNVYIGIEENELELDRMAYINFRNGETLLLSGYTITQAGKKALRVSVNPRSIPREGGVVSATVTSSKVWWFNTLQGNWEGTIIEASTGNRIYPLTQQQPVTGAVYYLTTNPNNYDADITYRIPLFYSGASQGTYSENITQSGVVMTITGDATFGPQAYQDSGEEVEIYVTSNAAFSISNEAATWVSVSPRTGSSGTTVVVLKANSENTGDTRYGSLYFAVGGNNIKSFLVTQNGGEEVVDVWSTNPDYFDAEPQMDTYSLFVYPTDLTVTWIAATYDSWITIENDTQHTGNGEVTFTVDDNLTGSMRSGYIDIIGVGDGDTPIYASVVIDQQSE